MDESIWDGTYEDQNLIWEQSGSILSGSIKRASIESGRSRERVGQISRSTPDEDYPRRFTKNCYLLIAKQT